MGVIRWGNRPAYADGKCDDLVLMTGEGLRVATFPELKEFDLIDSITQLVAFLPNALMFAQQKHRPTHL